MAPTWSKQTLGCGFVLATAAIWIVTSFISESLVSSSDQKPSQVHPFLLTYLATSLFTLYLPALGIKAWMSQAGKTQSEERGGQGGHASEQERLNGRQAQARSHGHADRTSPLPQTTSAIRPPKNTCIRGNDGLFSSSAARATMIAAAWVMPLWVLAQFTFNTSLAYTSVTSNTILSSSSSLFAFFFSIVILGEKFAANKLLAIVACIAGTALVTFSDNESTPGSSGSWKGDALAVLSAGLYGCYTVIMRKKLPGEDGEANVAMFFGFVGLFSTVALAPVVMLLSAKGVFSLASIPKEVYLIIVLEGLLDYVLSDYLWARAVMLIGPTVATLGMSIQIPMAATAELAMGRATWIQSGKTIIMTTAGTVLILSGLFTINLALKNDPTLQEGPKQTLKSRCSDTEDDQDEEAAALLDPKSVSGSRVEGGEKEGGSAAAVL